jgi:periplasmic divalent cation tolerance protein
MSAANPNFLLVLTTLPDRASAERLAAALVEQKLAACASVHAECQSIYRWQGAVESASEVPLQLKTTAARYPALEAAIRAAHPYDVPEIIALPISHGLHAYLSWLTTETS